MKAFYIKSLFIAALAMTLSSCEKSTENLDTLPETSTKKVSEVVYPLLDNEMSTSIFPKREDLPKAKFTNESEFHQDAKIKVIDLVCDEYLEQTTLLDLSRVPADKYQSQISDGKFSIRFADYIDRAKEGFRKLNNSPTGWWAHWNYSPYTEAEYPSVLLAEDKGGNTISGFHILLGDPVNIFGFEVAPNSLGEDVSVGVTYHLDDTYRSETLGSVTQTVRTPSGARLIAIKSDVAFSRVSISVGGKFPGAAITNIRYGFLTKKK